MKTLEELTNRESGIVLYETSEAILCNWSGIDGLPRMFATGIVGLGDLPDVETVEETTDCRKLLDGVSFIYSDMEDSQFTEEFAESVPATIFNLTDGTTVIVPFDWA